jgi:hypothetical protein
MFERLRLFLLLQNKNLPQPTLFSVCAVGRWGWGGFGSQDLVKGENTSSGTTTWESCMFILRTYKFRRSFKPWPVSTTGEAPRVSLQLHDAGLHPGLLRRNVARPAHVTATSARGSSRMLGPVVLSPPPPAVHVCTRILPAPNPTGASGFSHSAAAKPLRRPKIHTLEKPVSPTQQEAVPKHSAGTSQT